MLNAKQGIFGSSFFNFDNNTKILTTAKNFGIFWMITLPLTLVVLASFSMWPSLTARISKQKRLLDWTYDRRDLAVFPALARLLVTSLTTLVEYIRVAIPVVLAPGILGGKFIMWFRNGRLHRGMPHV